jgi:hypothetical protein
VQNATSQLNEQTRTQRDRLTGTLRSLGDDLDKMAGQADTGLAGDLAREVAQRAHAVSQRLEGREPGELLDDVRRFARQRPGTFLLGALGAGVVAGRLLRGTKDGAAAAAADSGSTTGAVGTTGYAGTTGTAPITGSAAGAGSTGSTAGTSGTTGLTGAENFGAEPTPSGTVAPAAPSTPGTQPGVVTPVESTPATRAGVTDDPAAPQFDDGSDLFGGGSAR